MNTAGNTVSETDPLLVRLVRVVMVAKSQVEGYIDLDGMG